MRFEATAGDLSAALDAAALALDDKSNVAALAMVRVQAQDEVRFVVDSLDRRVAVNAAATIVEPGEASARCTALVGVLSGLAPDRAVTIESNGDGIVVRSGRSRFAIAGLPLDTLPQSGGLVGDTTGFELDTAQLLRLLEICEHAICSEETRYYLNGIYLHIADNSHLRGVATDGHRLAWLDLPMPADADEVPGVIVPSKVVAILIKLLKRKPVPDKVSLRLTDKLIEVLLPNLALTGKLIDATYPDYIRIVPQESANAVTVDSDDLRRALARIEALFDEKSKRGMRTARLSWSDGALHVSLTSDSETDDVIDIVKTTGDGRFAARISYLTDVLEALASKKVTFELNGPVDPVIRVTDPDNAAAFAMVMPVRW